MQQTMQRAKQQGLILRISNWGIASRINNDLIVNKDIFKYPDYANKVIEHELQHNDSHTWDDLVHDMQTGSLFENLGFCFRHPKAFTHFIPVGYYRPFGFDKGTFYIDLNLIIIYTIAFAIIVVMLGLLLLSLKIV